MDVDNFIRDCAAYVGECKKKEFESDTRDFVNRECAASPIEKIFYTAVCTILETNYPYQEIAGQLLLGNRRDVWIEPGIEIIPQKEIGPYRVDFVLSYRGDCQLKDTEHLRTVPEKPFKEIVVELDGHAFHDRNARQRSYEKKRDRFLQKRGYEVFHYTGSDVVANPFKVAIECLARLTGEEEDYFDYPKNEAE